MPDTATPELNELNLQEQLPAKFGRFILHQRIGAGGMGVIYRATMTGMAGFRKTVAVKCILPHLSTSTPEFIDSLIAEAKIAVLMEHPNIIQIYDLGRVGEQFYISMEYVAGESMAHVATRFYGQKRRMPFAAVATMIVQVCRGLHYAHTLKGPD